MGKTLEESYLVQVLDLSKCAAKEGDEKEYLKYFPFYVVANLSHVTDSSQLIQNNKLERVLTHARNHYLQTGLKWPQCHGTAIVLNLIDLFALNASAYDAIGRCVLIQSLSRCGKDLDWQAMNDLLIEYENIMPLPLPDLVATLNSRLSWKLPIDVKIPELVP